MAARIGSLPHAIGNALTVGLEHTVETEIRCDHEWDIPFISSLYQSRQCVEFEGSRDRPASTKIIEDEESDSRIGIEQQIRALIVRDASPQLCHQIRDKNKSSDLIP